MIYALLWIEALIATLLWVAAWAACISHLPWGWTRRWLTVPIVLIALLPITACVLYAGTLKFAAHLTMNWFSYTASIWLLFVIGTTAILIAASRRPTAGLGPAARLWPRGRLALAALAALAVGAMTLWNADLTARAHAAVTKAQAGAMFLAVAPPSIPDSENAAVLYDRIIPRLQSDPLMKIGYFDPKPDDPIYIEWVKRQATTIRLLRRAAAMPNCRFDRDWAHPSIFMLFPELNPIHIGAILLQLDAQLELSAGHIDTALADINAINGLAAHIGQEPILISTLVAFSIDGMVHTTLQQALAQVTRPPQLDALSGLDPAADRRIWRRGLRGEECFGMTIYSEMQSGDLNPQSVMNLGSEASTSSVPTFRNPIEPFATLLRVYVLSNGLESYMQVMDEYQDLAGLPYYQAKPRLDVLAADSYANRRQGYFQWIFLPSLGRTFVTAAKAEANDACAQTAIAATRYRLDHGSLPAHLTDLVPDYLDAIPPDPFDGQPLRLAIKDGHWIVYSIGEDGRDDGGTPEEWNPKAQAMTGDVMFRLPLAVGSPATTP